MRRFCVLFILLTLFTQLPVTAQSTFVTVSGTDFYRNGKPYHYIGTNFWYGPILASKGQGGDRKRLFKELDLMKSLGIDNLRIQVGVDSIRLCKSSVPFLQLKPGVYNISAKHNRAEIATRGSCEIRIIDFMHKTGTITLQ